MSVTIANATIRIGASAEDVGAGVNDAIAHLNRLAAAALGIFGSIKVAGFLAESVKAWESANIGFEVMLKSGDKAKALLEDIVKFENEVPLRFGQITAGIQQLIAGGFSEGDAPSVFKHITDAAAAMGGDMHETTERIIRDFGKITSMGHITGYDLKQLQQARIPATRYIAEYESERTGKHVSRGQVQEEVTKKLIDASTAQRAIMVGIERDFGGLGKRMGTESFHGIFTSLVSQAEVAGTKVILALDKAFGLKGSLRSLREFFVELQGNAESFGQSIHDNFAVQVLVKGFQALYEIVRVTFDVISAGFDALGFNLGGAGEKLGAADLDVQKLRADMLDFLQAATRGFVRLADAISAIVSPFSAVKNLAEMAGTKMAIIYADKHGETDKVKALEAHMAKLKENAAQIADGVTGASLDKELGAVDNFFNKMRDADKIKFAEPTAQMKALIAETVAETEQLARFHKRAKELELKRDYDDHAHMEAVAKEIEKDALEARTPLKKLTDDLDALAEQFNLSERSAEEYAIGVGVALNTAAKGLGKQKEEGKVSDAIAVGSEEARRIQIASMQSDATSIPDLLQNLTRESEKQTRATQDLVDAANRNGLLIVPVQ